MKKRWIRWQPNVQKPPDPDELAAKRKQLNRGVALGVESQATLGTEPTIMAKWFSKEVYHNYLGSKRFREYADCM